MMHVCKAVIDIGNGWRVECACGHVSQTVSLEAAVDLFASHILKKER